MRKYILAIFLILPAYLMSIAQEQSSDSLRITGVVFGQDSLELLPYSKLKIGSSSYVSDEEGQFSFWAKEGEVVQFSHMGFKDTYLQVDDTLQYKNFMLGVFLTRDTVRISEVIVMPRYENLALQAKTMPLIVTPDDAYASNNVRSSTYQALTQTPLKMDAEMNQKMVLQERVWSTIYKTQIPPNQTVGITSDNLAQMRLFLPKNEQKVKEVNLQPLNRNELDLLLRIYQQRQELLKPQPE
ncbi:hypothetical protein [Carboxylicivirga sp. M1479]|uniref:hypothetical protein n=1 Tax=Carboxylicivirga sp. M1479 TaxID=2594476 RepID=UPI001177AAA2|nr:hypothetical protein [Carboxylicivirga sp. M1479]TRX70843.1 hypothetical protein FNN09_09275 [Carboxylicivirga sp. M1479]